MCTLDESETAMDQTNSCEQANGDCKQTLVDAFRLLASHWTTGVAVVTAVDSQNQPRGLTMSAVTTLSLTPPQYLICVDNRSTALSAFLHSKKFGINYLAADQAELSRRFASKIAEKFTGIPYNHTASGVPVLEGVIGFVECTVHQVIPGGDHQMIIGDVKNIITPGGEPLVHFRGKYRKLL